MTFFGKPWLWACIRTPIPPTDAPHGVESKLWVCSVPFQTHSSAMEWAQARHKKYGWDFAARVKKDDSVQIAVLSTSQLLSRWLCSNIGKWEPFE